MFKKAATLAIASLALISCANIPQPANAAQPTVLVMGEDWDEDSIPRRSQVFDRVMDAVEQQMVQEGFSVVNETMATRGNFVQGRVRRTDAELYDIAKSVTQPPIDFVVSFKIYPRFKSTSYSTKVNALLTGKVLNASKNQLVDNFEVKLPEDANAPKDCKRACAIEEMGKHSRILGQDLGKALALKLRKHMQSVGTTSGTTTTTAKADGKISRAYVMEFNNFSGEQRDVIEEYMVAFSGYQHHRVISQAATNGKYWYETTADDARVKRNIRKMMEYLNVQARVACAGTTCTVDRY
jgi:hypothetical protein